MEIIAKRVVDRSKYQGRMMFVDREGNVCVADRPKRLSPEEKAERQAARDKERKEQQAEGRALREALSNARKQARKNPSVENAEALEVALKAYEGR